MIPCIGVLVLNRGDLLLRMVDSIDVPVERLCIVQNGSDDTVTEAIRDIAAGRNNLINKVYIEQPFRNMGVAPSWNSIIKSFPECEYWLIANNDTVFLPGDLNKYHMLTVEHQFLSLVAAANGSFSCFTITPDIIGLVGLFDENIWPIYSEDLDYYVRMQKKGIKRINIPSDIGQSDNGSWTIRSNATYAANNTATQQSNDQYVKQKWGDSYQHNTPWDMYQSVNNDAEIAHSRLFTPYDPYRRKRHSAIWNNFEQTANRIR